MKDVKWDVPCPVFASNNKNATRAQKAGLAYEAKVAKLCGLIYGEDIVLHGKWFTYVDRSREHYAQPDILVIPANVEEKILLIECKLSYKKNAISKLLHFYKPLVEAMWPNRKVISIQVFRNRRFFKGECRELTLELLNEKITPSQILYINQRTFPK